ncbi:MAG: hypothetical protein UV80_C0005G0069 [Candidatus Peregrinibacteria bacterium GW2011_GWF2_43_17]|nr:MAG: hypothetical protein UV80_C0005G0069 [Candidatus Peregrinibacteria bacterium GW2011_GWF2_43_17]KKT20178.1 MAG: hypothetical protein UW03_C0008G0003 [Candidatus Peregrinibacteria bacterium GW2011_GWA2_43_8]HAU40015.1 hypothetical protein [Candidatus Peregrinibacteria bacterium]
MAIDLIQIRIPVGENKAETFEELLVNLHEVLHHTPIGLEIASIDQHIYFFVRTPSDTIAAVEGQIYALYPHAEISPAKEYINDRGDGFAAAEIFMKRSDIYPIKTFKKFEEDSISGIFSILAKADAEEEIWIQVLAEPMEEGFSLNFGRRWKMKTNALKRMFRLGDRFKLKGIKNLRVEENDAFKHKAEKHAYKISIRIADIAKNQKKAEDKLISLVKAYTQFNTIELNQFKFSKISKDAFTKLGKNLKYGGHSMIMSDEEVASVYHFPNPDSVPHIVHVTSRKAEPPQDLPKQGKLGPGEMSVFGITNYHNQNIRFGIKRADRRRHLYVVGKSGTGKSKMLELLIISDILAGKGVGVLDPHGDLVDAILKYIPDERKDDVVLFDPADAEYPIAFNPLEQVPPELRLRVTIGFVEIFHKLFGANWTPRLEHVLRYTTLALLDSPGTTIFSILKMLSDKNYRQKIVANIQDSVIKNFWVNEFASWSEKFDNEAIMPLLNKVGQFVSTSLIRNIVGQPENKINIRKLMDEQKILLMKISKGKLGEENCGLIGAMMVTKIQQAAMSRADMPEEDRKDFYLYCDEFQYFATDTFAEILSEARKYRLNVTMAHQYMGQLNDLVKTTVFGNVGSIISFRVGAEDAVILEKEYTPKFTVRDIINLGVREFYVKMSVNGQIRDAFSGYTVDVPKPNKNIGAEIRDLSRQKYARPLAEVNEILKKWEEGGSEESGPSATEEKFTEPLI